MGIPPLPRLPELAADANAADLTAFGHLGRAWLGLDPNPNPNPNPHPLVIQVGRELVRICQVQHSAASATRERVKSLLPRHPVSTAALLRNPELTVSRARP